MDNVADIHQPETGTARNGGSDLGIRELQFRIIDRGLVGLDHALDLSNRGALRIELLFCNDLFVPKRLIPSEVGLGIAELRLVFGKLPLSLLELYLKRPRV